MENMSYVITNTSTEDFCHLVFSSTVEYSLENLIYHSENLFIL